MSIKFDWEEWFNKNKDYIKSLTNFEGYYCDSEARDECFVFTKFNGVKVFGVGIDHIGRNPNDKDVMYVENILTQIRDGNYIRTR